MRVSAAARAAALGLVLLVQGCATLSEGECRTIDWYQLGLRDGSNGYPRARLDEHRSACSEFQLKPDDVTWSQGYEAGVERYCEVDNGYRIGRGGGSYGGVCPAHLEPGFLAAYRVGNETYSVERDLNQVLQSIESAESRLTSDKTLGDDDRYVLRRQLRELDRQASSLRRSRDRLEDEWRYRFERR